MNSRTVSTAAICAVLVYSTISRVGLGQTDPAAERSHIVSGEAPPPPASDAMVCPSLGVGCCEADSRPSYCCPRWTASADFMILDRVGSFNQTLVETAPSGVHVDELFNYNGTEVLNATDLHQGFAGGPRLGLVHHGDGDGDLELVYFQIGGWSAARSIGPDPNDWLVMKAPGGFVQTQDHFDTQMMAWEYASRLYSAEVNVRWNPWRRLTLLAGFRWVNLTEELQGTLPPERTVPFWENQTKNNLYGFQIGAEGTLLERGRFSIGWTGKAGLFDDHADETTTVSIYRILFGEPASTDRAAFVGQTGLECKYQVTQRLSLRASYEAIWLQGIALAPGQIPDTVCHRDLDLTKVSVQATGVNCNSGAFYHGATVGLEYSF